ncbi:MAG: glycosyltransferase [Flavobacteriales bacterium]
MFHGARILVAPLDWGLGHAARCVPIIRALQEQGAVPVIGADKGPLALLREEFPLLEHVRIPGMEVRYAKGRSQAWAMAKQFPAMLRQVREEQHMFERLRRELALDAVISDQRFGIRGAGLPSVLITHQLFPFAPFAQGVARRINRRHIDRFDLCWVPDRADAPGLSGALSHGEALPPQARFIGPLNRFAYEETTHAEIHYRVVAVISGPETQRTLLEDAVRAQLKKIEGSHLIISGKPGTGDVQQGKIRTVGHLKAEELSAAMRNAELVISRTGYTTLMDLAAIGRGALLVPTPGQLEQEYLGRLHREMDIHRIQEQHRLDIAEVLRDPPGKNRPQQNTAALLPAMNELARLITQRRNAIQEHV